MSQKKKKIRFYCSVCNWLYELKEEECTIFDMKKTTFLRQKVNTYAASVCPKCLSRNVEQIRSKKNEKDTK